MKAFWSLVAASVTSLLLTGVARAETLRGEGYGFPKDVSLEGWRIDWLIEITGVFTIILFVIMCAWMGYSMIKHGKDHKADYDHGNTKHHVIMALSISAVIFLIVDGNLFYNSIIDLDEAFWNYERAEKSEDVVRIEVNGRQWAWNFRYAGEDKKFNTEDDIVTFNEMFIPVNKPIAIQLTAVDVIHALYLPNLRVKTDAIPGTVNRLWFQATEAGEFDLACAQMCGTAHYKMKGVLHIMEQADYDEWEKEATVNSKLDYEAVKEDGDAKYSAHWGWDWDENT